MRAAIGGAAIAALVLFSGCGGDRRPADGHPAIPSLRSAPVHAARRSVMRVDVVTCRGKDLEGAGFVIAHGVVATAAHLTLQTRSLAVGPATERRVRRAALLFEDRATDVALLSTETRGRRPLRLARASKGTFALAMGVPGSEFNFKPPLREQPVRLGEDGIASIPVGGRRVSRPATEFAPVAGSVGEGYSGGPLVRSDGSVVGMVSGAFLLTAHGQPHLYATWPLSIGRALVAVSRTGPRPHRCGRHA
jgi:S1-C subfamily serine protease